MILNEIHEPIRLESKCGRSPLFSLPLVPLPLVQIAPFYCLYELLRRASVTAVIRLHSSSGRNSCAVMKIIVPERIQAVAAFFGWPNQSRVLHFVFFNQIA